jgi:PAS domain-containing protein
VYRLSNPAHWRAYGLSEQDIVGKTAHDLFGDEVGDHQRTTDLQAMAQQAPLFYEDQLVSRVTGKVEHVELVKVAMRDETGQCHRPCWALRATSPRARRPRPC